MVYPRVNNFSILILSLSYLFVFLSFISDTEEVDGVRKEKERLTTDHQPLLFLSPASHWSLEYISFAHLLAVVPHEFENAVRILVIQRDGGINTGRQENEALVSIPP